MSHEENTGNTHRELVERAWQLADSISTALLVTRDGDRHKARPMSATVDSEQQTIYFLASANADSVDQIGASPQVTVAFADTGSNKYVTFSGSALVSNDRARIKRLWTPFAKAWWQSADDPAIRVISVAPNEAELWDSPGKFVAAAIMLSAAVTGTQPAVGDHAKVRV